MNFYLGCAVWSYQGWVGSFYPPKSKSPDFLRLYSQRFTTVEGNTTFYAVPSPEKVKRWVQETASGFQFCPKFPQTITHQGLLQPSIPSALDFIERMRGLGDRLGVIALRKYIRTIFKSSIYTILYTFKFVQPLLHPSL